MGLVGSGKSYLATLCSKMKNGLVVTFAEEVYMLAEKVLQRQVNKSIQGDRELLKLIGTSWGREGIKINEQIETVLNAEWRGAHGFQDIWLDALVRRVNIIPPSTSLFNDDTRFFNELVTLSTKLHFLPVFVACTESTRINRLKTRGELNDPNDKAHKSEAMVNELSEFVLNERGIPVIWNDDSATRPNVDWVFDSTDFLSEVANHQDYLTNKLSSTWSPDILKNFSKEVKNG